MRPSMLVQSNMSYIMHPAMHANLQCVSGFANMNGRTYQQHINIWFGDRLTPSEKTRILQTETVDEALSVLSEMGIDWTHDYDE